MRDGDNDESGSGAKTKENQLGFPGDRFNENPRRLEPVFDDYDTSDDVDNDDDDDEPMYASDYEDDTIDYDVDPDATLDDFEDDFEDDDTDEDDFDTEELDEPLPRSTAASEWVVAKLKPELEAPTKEKNQGSDDWLETDKYYEDSEDAQQERPASLPIGLIVIAVFALALLGAGGYGVMKQRAEMQEQIRTLQATNATSARSEDMSASREVQRELQQRNTELEDALAAQRIEIGTLQDTSSGMQSRIMELEAELQEKAQKAAAPVKPGVTKTTPAPATAAPVQSAATGTWFVNFGSYQEQTTAGGWAKKLNPGKGEVIVAPGSRNGSTFYRVRIIKLASKAQAQEVAARLEQAYDLPKLWIGQQ